MPPRSSIKGAPSRNWLSGSAMMIPAGDEDVGQSFEFDASVVLGEYP